MNGDGLKGEGVYYYVSNEVKEFQAMLKPYHRFKSYWTFAENNELDIDRLKADLPEMSHGEQIMARFFACVWLGNNDFEFDYIDAIKTLDQKEISVIGKFMLNPLFP